MTRQNTKESGFTAIELLITLFVAAAFLVSGYQLYGAVIKDSGQARAKARAANVAYDYLKRYSVQVGGYCTPNNALSNSPVSISGLSSVTVSVDITCPKANASGISKVNVTIKYNNPQKTLTYSTYARTGSGTLEDGLIGWWPLNGNASDNSTGGNNGTVNGADLTTGQSGMSNSAYALGNSGKYISVGSSSVFNNISTTGFTMGIWLYRSGASVYHWPLIYASGNSTHSSYGIRSQNYGDDIYFEYGNSPYDGSTFSWIGTESLPVNQWHYYAITYTAGNPGSLNAYWDGSLAHTKSATLNPMAPNLVFGSVTNGWNGKIDDARLYSRVLSADEIFALYSLGAF